MQEKLNVQFKDLNDFEGTVNTLYNTFRYLILYYRKTDVQKMADFITDSYLYFAYILTGIMKEGENNEL